MRQNQPEDQQDTRSHYQRYTKAHKRYEQSAKGKAARKRYMGSDKGKAARKRYQAKRAQIQKQLLREARESGRLDELLSTEQRQQQQH